MTDSLSKPHRLPIKKNLFSWLFQVFMVLLLVFLMSFSAYQIFNSLAENRRQALADVQKDLKVALNTTYDRIIFFVNARKSLIKTLGRNRKLIRITEDLLYLSKRPATDLKKLDSLKQARDFFVKYQLEQPNIGFFIISPKNISLASQKDENVGKNNFIGLKKQDLMQRVLQGETVFVPPLVSDIALDEDHADERPKTLFFATPIINEANKVIAILTLRLLPEDVFFNLTQQAPVGNSGETYLIDETGGMFTTSRSRDSLSQLGVLSDYSQTTQVELRDPNVNLLQGEESTIPFKNRPFTRVAKDIIQLSQQSSLAIPVEKKDAISIDMHGYNDYRGVPVYGVWMWSDTLGFGLTTKIDQDEVIVNYISLRRILLLAMSITVVSTLIAIALSIRIGRKIRKERIDAAMKELLEQQLALRSQELKKLSVVIDENPNSIMITDLDAHIEYVNPRFTEVTGYSSEEILGQNPQILKSSLTPKATIENLWDTLLRGETWHGEFINQRKNGETHWEKTIIAPIRDENNVVNHYVAIKEDITKYKEAEEKNTRLGQVLEESWNEIYMFDPKSLLLTQVNKGARHNLGYSMEELKKLTTVDIKPDYDPEYFLNLIKPLRERKLPYVLFQTRHKRKDGSIYPIEVRLQLVETEHSAVFVGIIQDITERKKTEALLKDAKEAAEQASLAKSQFVANMSHELRTPLNAILGFSQIMANGENLTPKQRENLKIINRSGDHLLSLINDVLNISKIEAGKIEFQKTDFDLFELLDELEPLFQDKLAKNKLSLKVEYQGDTPNQVHTDKTKLRQILVNLINNAIKFTDEGGIIIRLSSYSLAADNNVTLVFEVEDTGCGIAENELDAVFQNFVQTSCGLKASEGAGLGLAISREFIQLMGGDISVSSVVNKGSIFKFTVLVGKAEEAIKAQPEEPKIISLGPNQSDYNILIVDDDAMNRLILMELLQPFGFNLKEAENGKIAVDICQKWKADMVFMDIRMPVMDGHTASIKIKEISSETFIVAVTASVFEDKKAEILESGCDDFIAKPFKHTDIFIAMQKYLGVNCICETENELDKEYILTPESLNNLPSELKKTLQQAIEIVDIDQVEKVVEKIGTEDKELAEAIQKQIDDFEYEFLLTLFQ
ncbi:MAG: PAS domain S-box protein [Methylococcales bacterium]|nr:PAS domain S-box protein [Methylococcales bacterium]